MCDKAVSGNPVILKYYLRKYKAQEKCERAVDDFLLALEFVSDWFFTSKMIKKLDTVLFADSDEDSCNVIF